MTTPHPSTNPMNSIELAKHKIAELTVNLDRAKDIYATANQKDTAQAEKHIAHLNEFNNSHTSLQDDINTAKTTLAEVVKKHGFLRPFVPAFYIARANVNAAERAMQRWNYSSSYPSGFENFQTSLHAIHILVKTIYDKFTQKLFIFAII